MNLSLIGQSSSGPIWIQFLVQIQDMDLNNHLAKNSTKISRHILSNSKNTVACSAMTSQLNLDFDLQWIPQILSTLAPKHVIVAMIQLATITMLPHIP